jgi:sugar phosphate isomerase/epimerase
MRIDGHDIAVCSWSIKDGSMADLIARVRELGLSHVQLALGRLLFLDDKRKHQELSHWRQSGLQLTATMMAFPGEDYSSIARIRATGGIVPDDAWTIRKKLTIEAARLTQELGATILTMHVGFIPMSNHPDYQKMISRVGELAAALCEFGVTLAMETGQEQAETLLQFLNDLPSRDVGVNFDPANMILYGSGDPIDAIRTLGRHIRHVHVKDATASERPGLDWGKQVPIGTGDVNWREFLKALQDVKYTGPLAIERETGSQTVEDLQRAIAALQEASIAQESGA